MRFGEEKHAVVGSDDKIKYLYDDAKGAKSAARSSDRIVLVSGAALEGDVVGQYYDADASEHKTFVYRRVNSMAGHVSGPDYRVSYYLAGGGWLNGIRHTDGGDLMTDVKIESKPSVTGTEHRNSTSRRA